MAFAVANIFHLQSSFGVPLVSFGAPLGDDEIKDNVR